MLLGDTTLGSMLEYNKLVTLLVNSSYDEFSFLSHFSNFMRSECLNSRYAYEQPLPVSRLVAAVGNSILLVNCGIICCSDVFSAVCML